MANTVTTKLEKLNLMDRFLFDEVMEDKEAYEAVIKILLENEIELLEKPETEKEFRVSPELRQIRLDVSLLEPGSKDFNLLNDSCLILISPFDIFERGLYRYTFEGVCRECPDLKIEDGAVRIFINTKGSNKDNFSQEFLDFAEYVTDTSDEMANKTNSDNIKLIHERVKKIRASEKMGVKYMQLWEEKAYIRDEGIEEGLAKGLEKGHSLMLIHMVCKKLRKGKNIEEIAEELEEEHEEIRKICNAAKKFAPDYDAEKIYEQLLEEKSK